MVANEVSPAGDQPARSIWVVRGVTLAFGLVAIWIGYVVGVFILTRYPFDPESLKTGSVLATGGALIATIKEFLNMGPQIRDFWKTGAGIGGYKLTTFLFLLSTGLTLALKANFGDRDAIGRNSKAGTPVMFVYPSEPSFSIPFLEEASECALGEKECDEYRVRVGTTIPRGLDVLFDNLVRGLTACSLPDSQLVEVEITGYASSSPFGGKSSAASRRLNKEIANARAMKVKEELLVRFRPGATLIRPDEFDALVRDTIVSLPIRGEQMLRITAHQWESFADMIDAGKYNDLEQRRYVHERGILNRRATIRVVRLGNCRLEYP